MALLVFDEQIANPKLVAALQDRGIDARTVGDFGVTGRPDPDVVRRVQDGLSSKAWVLVTMDLTIVEEHEGFKWERYALAWIKVRDGLLGVVRGIGDAHRRHSNRDSDEIVIVEIEEVAVPGHAASS